MEPTVAVTSSLQGYVAVLLLWDNDMDRYLYSEDVGEERRTYEVAMVDAMLYSQFKGVNLEDGT